MPKETILMVKKRLAAAFPEVEFTYGAAGRGRMAGPCISWTGGPTADLVKDASLCRLQWRRQYYFSLHKTPAERAEIDATREAERPACEAAEAAAKIERREAGKLKSAETRARNAAIKAKLAEAFPGVEFTSDGKFGWSYPAWTDGPTRAEVAALLGRDAFHLTRYVTPARLAADALHAEAPAAAGKANMAAKRLARRLAQSKVRAIRVARGADRRARQPKRRRLWLPFGPGITVYNAAVFAGTYTGVYA
jgi:hypothetical protein